MYSKIPIGDLPWMTKWPTYKKMKTWFLVSLLLDKQAITCKWIYKKVLGINGEAK
jgi:hypothetical protein